MKSKLANIGCLTLILTILLVACEKQEITPGHGQESYVNFNNASEAISQGKLTSDNMVFINDSLPTEIFKRFPEFSPNADEIRAFPAAMFGDPGLGYNVPLPSGIDYNRVFWFPITSGDYHFIYTSVNKVYLKDTIVTLLPKTLTTLYLIESPNADDAYRIIAAPIERKSKESKVRFQIVNLSPDIGNLEVFRTDENGDRLQENLPSNLPYGEYSNYIEIDTVGASRTRGQILLHFRKSGTSNTLVSTAIPAISNSEFTLTFQGFEKETVRRVKIKDNEYQQVNVTPNLRVIKRRTF